MTTAPSGALCLFLWRCMLQSWSLVWSWHANWNVHGESFGISGQCFADIKRGCEGKWLILDNLKNSVACYRLTFMFEWLLGMSVLVVASSVWVLMEVDAGCRFWSFCPVDTHCFKAQSTNCRTSYCLIKPCRPVKVVECATWWKVLNLCYCTEHVLLTFFSQQHLSWWGFMVVDICRHSILDGTRGHTELRWIQWEGQSLWSLTDCCESGIGRTCVKLIEQM